MDLFAFDIETSGLDPTTDRVLAVGLAGHQREDAALGPDEADLLTWLERTVEDLPGDAVLVTWNGEEFDLPFLAARMDEHGLVTALRLEPRHELGKYGKPRHAGTWGGRAHVDIAYPLRRRAEEAGVKWSLKPVARAVLGAAPVEVDRRGEAIAAMDSSDLQSYVLSDARVTYELARHLAATPGSLPLVG